MQSSPVLLLENIMMIVVVELKNIFNCEMYEVF